MVDQFMGLSASMVKAVVPEAGASTEDKRAAQQARSRRFGIEALENSGEALSYPAGYPTDLDNYADPVNLKFPLSPDGRARNARARFKQFAGTYQKPQSRKIVHTRIVDRLLKIGASPSLNEDDPLDAALPSGTKARMRDALKKLWAGVL